MALAWRGEAKFSAGDRAALKRQLVTSGAESFSEYHVDLAVDVTGTTLFDEIVNWLQSNKDLTEEEKKDATSIGIQNMLGITREKAYHICEVSGWEYEASAMRGMEALGGDGGVDSLWDALKDDDKMKFTMESQIFDATLSSIQDQRKQEFDSMKLALASSRDSAASKPSAPPPPPPPLSEMAAGMGAMSLSLSISEMVGSMSAEASAPPMPADDEKKDDTKEEADDDWDDADDDSSDWAKAKPLLTAETVAGYPPSSEEASAILKLLSQLKADLQSMGFMSVQINKAMEACPVYDVQTCKRELIQWILKNPLSPAEEKEAKLTELMHSGFTREECVEALSKNSSSISKALLWLNHGKPLCLSHYMHNMAAQLTMASVIKSDGTSAAQMMALGSVETEAMLHWDISPSNYVFNFATKSYLVPEYFGSLTVDVTAKTVGLRCLTKKQVMAERIPSRYAMWTLSRGRSKARKMSGPIKGDFYKGPSVLRHNETRAYLSYDSSRGQLFLSKKYDAQCVVFLSKYDFVPIAKKINTGFVLGRSEADFTGTTMLGSALERQMTQRFVDEVETECVICYEEEPNVVLKPCGHQDFCYTCMADKTTGKPKFDICPICRGEIVEVIKT